MKQIEDFLPYKVTFSSVKFFAIVMLMFFAWGYRAGAGEEAGTISLLVFIASFIAAFFYPLHTIWLHFTAMAKAKKQYQVFAGELEPVTLHAMLAEPGLRVGAKKIIRSVLQEMNHHDA